jgi:hypothetical protein
MQAHLTTDHIETRRLLETAASIVVVSVLVVAFLVASLGLGFEGRVAHGPIPAPAPGPAPVALHAD